MGAPEINRTYGVDRRWWTPAALGTVGGDDATLTLLPNCTVNSFGDGLLLGSLCCCIFVIFLLGFGVFSFYSFFTYPIVDVLLTGARANSAG